MKDKLRRSICPNDLSLFSTTDARSDWVLLGADAIDESYDSSKRVKFY